MLSVKYLITNNEHNSPYMKELVEQKGNRPRKLTVNEAMQLQGFNPDKFIFPVSATQAYTQIGNSVVVPAIAASAKIVANIIKMKSL